MILINNYIYETRLELCQIPVLRFWILSGPVFGFDSFLLSTNLQFF